MRNQEHPAFFHLVGRYVNGDISEEQGNILLQYINSSPEMLETVQKNLVVDLLLSRLFAIEQGKNPNRFTYPATENLSDFVESPEKAQGILSELIAEEQRRDLPIPSTHYNHWECLLDLNNNYDPEWNTVIDFNDGTGTPRNKSLFHSTLILMRRNVLRLLALGGIVVLVGIIILVGTLSFLSSQKEIKEAEIITVAQVVETLDAVWPSEKETCKRGQYLPSGLIDLKSGIMKIQYKHGSEVILQGPCRYMILGEKSSFCQEGRISATISKAGQGFQISTPFGTVTDLGTEFLLNVTPNECRTSVIKGKVEFQVPELPKIPLLQGFASMVNSQRVVRDIPMEKDIYISQTSFETLALKQTQVIESQRESLYQKWERDPNLLAFFVLANENGAIVRNRSLAGRALCKQLSLAHCTLDEGPLWGTKSIRFQHDDSYGRFHLAGSCSSLTIIVNLRVDRLANQGNTICGANDFFNDPGAFHWQIARNGSLQFFISTDKKNESLAFETPIVWNRNQYGSWAQLAVVVDGNKRTVSQFYNGKLLARKNMDRSIALQLEDVMIGNAMNKNVGENKRNFTGNIECFQIFNRALTPPEIRTLCL